MPKYTSYFDLYINIYTGLVEMGDEDDDTTIATIFQGLFKALNVFLYKGPPDTTGEIDMAAYQSMVSYLFN